MLSTEMNWEVVQDFLNVSGIKGVALIDGQSRPHFKGIEKVLNSQQREALAQGVWQVLETIPENFDSFEFQFAGTQVYIHKMTQGLILLVLTHDSLLYPDYCEAFTKLKAAFEADGEATLESFRRLLGARNTSTVSPTELKVELTGNQNLEAETEAPSQTNAAGSSQTARPAAQEAEIAREIAQNLAAQNHQGGADFTTASAIADTLNTSDSDSEADTLNTSETDHQPAASPSARTNRADSDDTLLDFFSEEPPSQDDQAPSASTPQSASTSPQVPYAKASETEELSGESSDALADNPFASSMAAPPDAMTEAFAELPDNLPTPAASDSLPDVGLPNVGLPDVGEVGPGAVSEAILPDVADVGLPDVGLPDVSGADAGTADPELPSGFSLDDITLNDEDTPVSTSPSGDSAAPDSQDIASQGIVSQGMDGKGIDTEASAQGLPLEDWLTALNCLGQCAVHYLGRAVVVNYWRKSRPDSDWLAKFDVERSTTIKAGPDLPLAHGTTLEQQQELQDWADRFAQRCGRVIRDFPQLAETQGFSSDQRELLGL